MATSTPDDIDPFHANTPSLLPPQGVQPNFINPETMADVQLITTSVILAIALLFALNRLYIKVALISKVTWDDCTFTLALVIHFSTMNELSAYGL